MASSNVLFVFLTVLAVSLSALADRPAVSITKPDQGDVFSIGDSVPTTIIWPSTDTITYSKIEIAIIDYGSALAKFPDNAKQIICSYQGLDGADSCPAIKSDGDTGAIDFAWILKLKDESFTGKATLFVRAFWQAATSSVPDTLQQTLTIVIGPKKATPTKKPSPTKKPTGAKTPSKPPTPTGEAPPTPSKKASPSKKPTPTGEAPPTPSKKATRTRKPTPTGTGPVATPTKRPSRTKKPTPTETGPIVTPSKRPTASFAVTKKFAPTRPGSVTPCILTQIGSEENLCPIGSGLACCADVCAPVPSDGFTGTCCTDSFGIGYFCAKGLNCCSQGCCVNKKKIPI